MWGLVWGLVAACLAATFFGCALDPAYSGSIWVKGYDGGNSGEFNYSIGNTTISENAAVDEFKLGSSKAALFDGLRKGYRVFAESTDTIQLIYNSQIYTVRQYADGHYSLYGEYFMATDRDGATWPFPFPTDKIVRADPAEPVPYVGTEFTVNCDLPYLLRFYEVYGNAVKVEGNTITYGGLAITVEDGGRVEVDVP
jgi:hypothetical protein